MADRKWEIISSGATFEALVATIVFFEDPKAALFGRRGKDGGQDARSGDGTRVFQAKHHEDASAASAIRDAKKELAKIRAYRQPGHARHEQWRGVTQWRLVTNATFNPTDKETWDKEIVPLFAAEGLVADYWEQRNLDGYLDKYPEIHRSFFENENRVFLSVPELRERLPAQEPFLRRNELGTFCGRSAELTAVLNFLASSQLFLVVHGAGGVGKTRILVEAGEKIASEGTWQVLWANIASMSATGAWFESIVPERPTLVLIDEPPDESILKQLSEQLGGRVGRATRWKVAIAVRSPKDPVLRFLFGPRMKPRVAELTIGTLLQADAEAMCRDLLESGELSTRQEEWLAEAARELSQRFGRHPIWLTLAIHLLEEHGELTKVPATAKGLADDYLSEIVRSQNERPPEQIMDLLRWIALVGTVNREDDSTIELLTKGAHFTGLIDVKIAIAKLVSRRALIERGAHNRFVEIKPDVLRDHVLREWLTADVGFGQSPIVPSDNAKALVVSLQEAATTGQLNQLGRAILVSLSRTELLLRLSGNNVPLLESFFSVLHAAVPGMTASQRLGLIDAIGAVAAFHPSATATVIESLRESPAPQERLEGIFGSRTVGQQDVLLALAWPLFSAAMGAQDARACEVVLRELCAVAEAEAEISPTLQRGLPNDGKRATALIARVLEGGPQFWCDFDATARQLSEELLAGLSAPPTVGKRALLNALVLPALAIHRSQWLVDENTVHIQTYNIGQNHPAWATRLSLLARVKNLLSLDTTPTASRVALWQVFASAHQEVNRLRRDEKAFAQSYDQLLHDLMWARQILAHRNAPIEELSASRSLWDWHRQFETDSQVKAAAEQLELLYSTHHLASEFEPLLPDWSNREQQGPRWMAKAAELASVSSAEDLAEFINRAVAFLGSETKLEQLNGIAWHLGSHARVREAVAKFVKLSLQSPTVSPRTDFGITIAASWVASVRTGEQPEQTMPLVRDLMATCGSKEQQANLLLRIYGRVPKLRDIGEFSADEIYFFRSESKLFLNTDWCAVFVGAVSLCLKHDWSNLQILIKDILRSLPTERRAVVVRAFVDGVYWAVQDTEPTSIPSGLSEWVLDQLLLLPDLDDLGDNVEWHLKEIFKRTGPAQLSWLPGALEARRNLEINDTGTRAVGYRSRVSKYVKHVTEEDVGNTTITQIVEDLIAFESDNGSVGYRLPEVLHDIDPEGFLVPAEAVKQLNCAVDLEQARRLTQIGAAYGVGRPSWRIVAKAALTFRMPQDRETQITIMNALESRRMRRWSGTPGEVPAVFIQAVDRARTVLDTEKDPELRLFWEWRLSIAEAELREQEEEAKEERGE